MEDFNLKDTWSASEEAAAQHFQQKASKIEQIAARKSQNILYRINRMFWIEMWVSVVLIFVALLLLYVKYQQSGEVIHLIFGGVFTLSMVFSYFWLYRIFKHFSGELQQQPLGENIRTTIDKYLELIQFYKRDQQKLYAILTPIFFIIGYGYGAELSDGDLSSLLQPIVFIVGVLVMIGMYFLVRKVCSFYFDMLMHKIVRTLKHLQKELNSNAAIEGEEF